MSAFSQKTSSTPSKTSSFDIGRDSFFGIQAKLNIGKSNDKYEVEADKVADKIVSKKQPNTAESFFSPSPLVQKKLTEEVQKQDDTNKEIQQKEIADSITPVVQLNPIKEEIQQKTEANPDDVQAKKEAQPKAVAETIKPVIQLAPAKEEEIQQKSETKTEEIQTKKEVQPKALVENLTPVIQLAPAKEEEIQQKTETSTEEVQQKNITEKNAHNVQLAPIKEEDVQPKNEKNKEPIQLKKETITVEPSKINLTPTIQPKVEEEVQEKKEEEVQGKEEEGELQMSAASATPNDTSNLETNLNSSKGGGSPLPTNTKTEMESGFGTDFSSVKIHNDSKAVQMNQQLGSQAFANGSDIYFNEGKFNPSTQSGKHLLAHELTHTVQQGGAVRKKPEISATSKTIQPSLLSFAVPGFIKDNVRHIPGYTLLTVISGYDPLNDVNVPRTAINLIEGFMGLIPFGTAIFDKLQEYGIIDQVFEWVESRLSELNLNMQALLDLVQKAWDESSITTFVDVVTEKFNEVVDRVTAFATSLVDQVITWIKEALIGVAEPLLAENKAWALIKKIIKYDPLRDEEVNATTVEILEDFLILIGKETELEQMREKGTLQKTADWLDTQVGTFTSLLGELRGLITMAWDAIQPANLANISENLTHLATQAGGFLQRVWDFAVEVATKVLELVKESLLGWLSSQASGVRGYSLIKVIIGKDPFTSEVVERSVPNLIRGFMSLMEGGEEQYAQMVESGAIARIVGEIEAAVATLNMTPESIIQLFTDLWNSFTIDDLIHPLDAFIRIIEKFGEPIGRLIAFVAEIVRIVIVAILEIMNFPFDLIGNIITRALEAIEDIKRDPIGFLKNILRAIKQGFVQFFDNIVTHLIGGVTGWLMSELRDANVPVLTDFSLQGVISWVLEVLGISMERIWEKLAEHPRIGPERVARIRGVINTLEGIWTFIRDVQERGMAAIWDKIQEQLSNLWNTVLDAVKNFVMERIVSQITARLISMLDPTGIMAVINGAVAFYNAIQSFIRYLREMLEIVNSFVSGVADIARGNVATAANYLERTMGQAMPVVIGFLANQVGLSGIGRRVGEMIVSVREMVDQALTWLVNQAVDRGMSLLDRIMGRGGANAAPPVPNDPSAHRALALEAKQELENVPVNTTNPAEALQIKQQAARSIENTYSSRLQTPLRMTITLTEQSHTEASEQIATRIVIAPNDTVVEDIIVINLGGENINIVEGTLLRRRINLPPHPQQFTNGRVLSVNNGEIRAQFNLDRPSGGSGQTVEIIAISRLQRDFAIPLENLPIRGFALGNSETEHTNYKPKDLKRVILTSGSVQITYKTEGNAEFTVDINQSNETKVVSGRNLSLKRVSGRGVTQDSHGFITGVNLNRAHLIADRFLGSGYTNGENLITTSSQYNQRDMADAENNIEGRVPSKNIENADNFDLTVSVQLGNLSQSSVQNAIEESIPAAERDAIMGDIQNFATQHSGFKVCMGVAYNGVVRKSNGVTNNLPNIHLDPDRYLGS